MLKRLLLICCLIPLSVLAQVNTDQVTLMGRNALYFDDFLTAIRYFNKVIETKPYLDKPYYYRAYAKFSLEDFRGAEDDCEACIERNPYLTEVYQLRGLCRIHNKNFEGAVADYGKVLEETEKDFTARYNRALCNLELKHLDAADTDIDKLLSFFPRHFRAYLVKAQIALERTDTAKATFWVDSLLTLTQRDASAWSMRAKLAMTEEQWNLADSCATKAIELETTDDDHYMLRAQARHSMNRFDAAHADYNEVIRLVPHHFVAHYNRGLLRSTVGDDHNAIADFDYVLNEEPTNTLARYNRALLYERTGKYQEAIDDLTFLIKEYPNFVYGYALRADCKRRIGDIKGANNDDAFVERSNLDLHFGKAPKHPTKKVVTRTEKSLENYRQLVEETDTANTLLNELIGKVQNLKHDDNPMGMIAPVLVQRQQSAYYHSEIDVINKQELVPLRLILSADAEKLSPTTLEYTQLQLNTLVSKGSSSAPLVLRSIVAADTYNFTDAYDDATGALASDSLSVLALLQRANINYLMADVMPEVKSLKLAAALADAELLIEHTENAWAPAFYNKAVVLAAMERKTDAIELYTKTIALDPYLAHAYYNRALLYLKEGKQQEAEIDLSRAGELGLYKAYSLLKSSKR